MNYNIILKFILVLLVSYSNIKAQNLLEVHYTQTIRLPGLTIQPSILYHKEGQSVYVHSKGKKGTVMKKLDGGDWTNDLNEPFMSWYQDSVGNVIYKHYQNGIIKYRTLFSQVPYISEEDFPTIKWTVTREQKKVINYNCYKATTQFRGRNYTAWFTLDIPVYDGPWKFWGLPGLILEVYDDENLVKFEAQSVMYPSKTVVDFTFPTDGKKVDIVTYRQAPAIESEKRFREAQSKDYGRGVQVTISKGKSHGIERNYE